MIDLLHDLRYALRSLRRAPGFTLAAVLTLGLGIGATTAIFSVVNGVLLRDLPFPRPERLVSLRSNVSYPNLADILSWSRSYESGGGFVTQALDLVGDGEPAQVQAAHVSGGLFRALGATPVRGRTLDATDDRLGGPRHVVLSHEFWTRRLGADPNAVGRALTLSGETYTVVGVMRPGFGLFETQAEVFTPLHVVLPDAAPERGVNFLRTALRLAPGVTLEEARRELGVLGRRLAEVAPDNNRQRTWTLMPLLDRVVGRVRTALWVLFGAVSLALLVACSNFANLLLARSAVRAGDLAVRSSLGAGRGRLVGQLVTESVVLALAAGALGVGLAVWGVDLLVALRPAELPRLDSVSVDRRVLGFAALLSLVTGVISGLFPALHGSRAAISSALRQGGPTTTSGAHRTLNALVASQIALALVLLIGAGLLLNAFWRLRRVEPGFDPRGVLSLRLELPEAGYPDRARQTEYRERVLQALARIPGAEAAMVSELPLGGNWLTHNFAIEGRPPLPTGTEPELVTRNVAGDYFDLMGIPLRAGRHLAATDRAGAPPVGVINESMARTYFAGQNPIGQRVRWVHMEEPFWITIVGVVADVKHFALGAEEEPALYTPYAQFHAEWKRWMSVVLRSADGTASLERAAKQAIWSVDPRIPVTELRPMSEVISGSLAEQRFQLFLLGFFGAVALLLAALGTYAVMAYAVGRRTREIGLRMALGASAQDVYWHVVSGGMRVVLLGVALGALGALAVTRLLSGMLFEVSATDPATYVAVALALGAVALGACAIPAVRAARLEPSRALRTE